MSYPDNMLSKVTKPGRYVGGEWNSVVKDWSAAEVKVVLVYPDVYEIGMSNLALPILYEILNSQPGILAERAFAPWVDMEAAMRQAALRFSVWNPNDRWPNATSSASPWAMS